MSDSLIIIPTYNEKDNIRSIIEAVFGLEKAFDILVVDDGSPDGTAAIVHEMIECDYPDRLHIVERSGKLGLGTAYIHGFRWGIQNGYDYIMEMDADFSHDPNDLPRLYNACVEDGADIAVGSRYIKEGSVENWPMRRVLLSYFASVYVRMITFLPVRDTTAGFVCYRREVLEKIDLDKIKFIGYAFQIEMKFAAWQLGFKIKEIPIVFTDRVAGESKMSTGIFKEAALGVLHMRWNSFFNRYD